MTLWATAFPVLACHAMPCPGCRFPFPGPQPDQKVDWESRREIMKLVGIVGAIDPYRHKQVPGPGSGTVGPPPRVGTPILGEMASVKLASRLSQEI